MYTILNTSVDFSLRKTWQGWSGSNWLNYDVLKLVSC